MRFEKHLDFYLEPGLKQSAEQGNHNFIGKIVDVVQKAGFSVGFHGNSPIELRQSAARPGFSMFHMDEPVGPRTLTMRRVYHYPFWQIEATTKRWDWQVAQEGFDPEKIDAQEARRFYRFWRKRLFGETADQTSRDGIIYVPLQGRLTERRSFQTCSPLEMLVAVLQHDPVRRVVASLHPKEHYSPAEMNQLRALLGRFSRLSLQEVSMEEMLKRCDYVVTQNSAVAFNGFFFGKPCVLFGRVDFHHIAGDVFRNGREAAFQQVQGPLPDFERYLWWFWQEKSINAGRPEATRKIRETLWRHGWPV